MSRAVSPHHSSSKDPGYCLTEDDFTHDGLHKVLTPRLATELSEDFEKAVRRRFKHKKWHVSVTGNSPWRGSIPLVEVRPVPVTDTEPHEEESFVLDFNIIPVSEVAKKKNNGPVVHCRILRYVRKKYVGVIHESVRSGAGTYNPDQWAYLAHIVLKAWTQHHTTTPGRRRY